MTATLEAPAVLAPKVNLAELRVVPFAEHRAATVDAWEEKTGLRYAATATHLSPFDDDTDIGVALVGAAMLGLELTPQGCEVAAVMESRDGHLPMYDDITVEIGRRATKSTSIQAVYLGRCSTRKNHRIISTAQDGTRASALFMEMVRMLEATDQRDEKDRPWQVFRSTGREYLQWDNGSIWKVAPPKSGAFRGFAADDMWFDEGGELDPETTADLEAGALPLMDTRPEGQVMKSGTPAKIRQGMLWDSLKAARETPDDLGIVDYCANEVDVIDFESKTEAEIEAIMIAKHPGVSCGLTTLKKIKRRTQKMTTAQFIREYLCVWPADVASTALDLGKWASTAGNAAVKPPREVGFGFNVAIGGSAAAVAAAWWDENDRPHIQIMEYRAGSEWTVADLDKLTKAFPNSPVGYDNIGENISTAQALARKPRTNTRHLKSLQMKEIAAGTATIATALESLSLEHAPSLALDAAVEMAAWRESGGNRLFRRIGGNDISALLACVAALAVAAKVKRRTAAPVGYAPIT